MKRILPIIVFILTARCYGQTKPEDFGFRHLQMNYKGDTVDILVKSKAGDEEKSKPLFLFCQGSLPIPLMILYKDSTGKNGIYSVFPFAADTLSNEYHLAIINKPYVPLIRDEHSLNPDLTYSDGKYPAKYTERNLLSYYADRGIAVIKFLQKQPWISSNPLVVAGHSEGSNIAAQIAYKFPKVTHLIYSGGNPLGRIVTVVEQQRAHDNDSAKYAEQVFNNWKKIVDSPYNMNASTGDTYKATYEFSSPPPLEQLEKLKIPVLITYGTKDYGSPFNDYFRIKMIQQRKTNFTFKAYPGVEHNFFPLKANGEINYDIFNWDKVAADWKAWLKRFR